MTRERIKTIATTHGASVFEVREGDVGFAYNLLALGPEGVASLEGPGPWERLPLQARREYLSRAADALESFDFTEVIAGAIGDPRP